MIKKFIKDNPMFCMALIVGAPVIIIAAPVLSAVYVIDKLFRWNIL